MKVYSLLPMAAFVLVSTGVAQAQDPTKVDSAHYKVIAENTNVRVLRITYPAGSKSVMHSHPDTMVVPLATSKMTFATPDGKTEDVELPVDSAMFTPAGTHRPSNVGTGATNAILVEFKSAAPGTAELPAMRPNMGMKMLAESPQAVAYHVTAEPSFEEPAGSKHDYDQVVIALAPAQMSLSVNGKPAKSDWKRGDVALIGRGEPHESKNTSGKPVEYIIVAVK